MCENGNERLEILLLQLCTECNLMCFFDESLSVRAAVAKPKARKENQTKHYPKLNDFSWVVFCIS